MEQKKQTHVNNQQSQLISKIAGKAAEAASQKTIDKLKTNLLKTVYEAGFERGKKLAKNAYTRTENRLYAYPRILRKIAKYEQDIIDLMIEPVHEKSKDIIKYSVQASRLSEDEIREGRVLAVQLKLQRELIEKNEIEEALTSIQNDQYFCIIDLRYFKQLEIPQVAQMIPCGEATVSRHRTRLINILAVELYGADAL